MSIRIWPRSVRRWAVPLVGERVDGGGAASAGPVGSGDAVRVTGGPLDQLDPLPSGSVIQVVRKSSVPVRGRATLRHHVDSESQPIELVTCAWLMDEFL
jgi:hypothetical protein